VPWTVVAGLKPFFITFGGPQAWTESHDSSVEKHPQDGATLHGSAALPFVISTEAYPDFLSRRTRNAHVCAFP
jgi:hypothetical protein